MPAALLAWLLTLMHHLFLNGLRDGREHLLEPWDEAQGPTLVQPDPTPPWAMRWTCSGPWPG
jgi:DNA-directed RNA polymerase specialized sigma24 family protein